MNYNNNIYIFEIQYSLGSTKIYLILIFLRMKESKKIFENNWFAIGLFVIGSFLAIISVLGYVFNPLLFSSFSWAVFLIIVSIAVYMLYNIFILANEMKSKEDNKINEKSVEN